MHQSVTNENFGNILSAIKLKYLTVVIIRKLNPSTIIMKCMLLTLQAFKKQIFSFELIPEIRIDDEYSVVENVSESRANDESLPSVTIRPRTGK